MSLEVYPQSGPPGPVGPTASVLFSAGSLSSVRSDITFNNGSGVTFGLDAGGVITASVQTNYQTPGAYLTTAALSQDSSKYAGTTAGMTGGSLTVDTAGVAISLPAYLTTAQPPGAYLTTAMASNRGSDFVQATAVFFGTNATGTIASNAISISVSPSAGSLNISAGSTSSAVSAVTFSNGSGVTFGFDGSNVTASVQTNYQTSGAYLTTAALSQDSSKYAGTNGSVETTSGTDLALTLNTSGATIAYPAWLTTAQPPGAYLTTAALSQDSSKYAGTGFTTATTAGTAVVGTLNTSGLSMGIPAYLTTTPAGGAGTGFTSTSTAGSNVVGTLNSNGLSVGVPNYLTTAMASDATTLSNINVLAGSTNRNLSSFALASDHQIGFGFGTYTSQNDISASWNMAVVNSAGAGHFNAQNLRFDDSNGVTWGVSSNAGSTNRAFITATVRTNYAGTATSVATTTGTDLSFAANTSGITIAYPKWLTAASGGGAGTGFTTATTAGTAVVGTLDSNGLSMGVPAYLTTAALSANTSNYAGTNTSLQTTSGTDLKVTLNTTGLTIAYPAWLTTATGGGGSVNVSAGTTSNNLTQVVFSNVHPVSFGLNGSTITASAHPITGSTAPGSPIDGLLWWDSSDTHNAFVAAGTNGSVATTTGTDLALTLNTSGATIGYPKWITTAMASNAATISNIKVSAGTLSQTRSDITFSDSGGVSWGLNTNGVITATVATNYQSAGAYLTTAALSGDTSKYAGINGSVATTAGTDLALTLNTSGATIGYPKWITTAAQSSGMMSYFENMQAGIGAASTTLSAGISAIQVIPFIIPHAISVAFLRVPVSMSYVSTEASGTTANSTWTVNVSYTDAAVILTQKAGASSLSLGYLTSGSATWLFQNQIGAGAQGSRYTVTQNVTYPISGTTSNYTTSYPQSSANVQISSASMTLFTGPRWLDIPLAVSLSASNYWLALGRSTQSATQAGNAALGGASAGLSYIGISQNNISIGFPGAVTNSSIQLQPALGSWSTNAAVMSTSSIGIASVSAMSSNPKMYFQMIRYA